ncbi:cell division protein FtsK [Niastella yeongjuensis]|uniref:Cell division protein FtsK n=1 Tax=Niastella yeongjuensis TaxID=354355 RepID=A0A1V9F0S9_9BACT|nr:DNA translocase FtsK [Niastella yeongjuensis]OQP51866.1 cell division protein FtsK [Niastella yeongjuensis]SEP44166.1 DNA segregation ATPase FtsK/SpoIIIE, S-DNA-T family [Niastella yeongjuensis]
MANRLKADKAEKKKPAKSDSFKPEKEAQVTVKQLVKDERTHKIAGAFSILISLFLFIAFASYLFTWKEDQDKVFRGAAILLPAEDVKTTNLLGNLGAYMSHLFFYKGFGAASFMFCSLFFVMGVNALLGAKIFNLWRNVRYVIVSLLFFSVVFAFVFRGGAFAWGGAVGNMGSDWLVRMIGSVGTAALLLLGGLAYVIWRFNPVFKAPTLAKKTPEPVKEVVPAVVIKEEKETPVVKPVGNKLKDGLGVLKKTPIADPEEEPMDLQLVEKDGEEEEEPWDEEMEEVEEEEEEEEVPVEAPLVTGKNGRKKPDPAQLELEIKSYPEVDQPPIPVEESKVEPVISQEPYDPSLELRDYKFPSLELLELHGSERIIQDPQELETNKNQIINTLKNYDIEIQKISATVGPTVTLYEIVPAAGVRISRIKNLEDDIALSLAALGIRIIAPIPGKGTVGIEVPNVKKTVVSMRSMLSSEKFQNNSFSLPIAIGKKIDNENFIVDLTTMPHLLMAGATGQGKSVGLNAILVSLLYKKHPSQIKLVLVDPKKVELSLYRHIETHFLAKLPGEDEAIITDTKKVIHTLNALCIEMDNRYDLLKEAGARNIREYNEKFIKRKLNPQKGHQFLPFIVLVVDEFADLIMTAGKEVEMPIARLAQLARAVGIHLIIATQRPSVNIITGTIKANFPVRIAFKVSSKIDSRTILDAGGAEQLIGKGDMLISYNGEITRLQCAFVDTPEVDSICDFIGTQEGYPQAFFLPEYVDEKQFEGKELDLEDRDTLFESAARMIVTSQMGSTSLLQRRMKLGYNRAGRLMDQLEAAGIVGPSQGSKARDVLVKTEADLEMLLNDIG